MLQQLGGAVIIQKKKEIHYRAQAQLNFAEDPDDTIFITKNCALEFLDGEEFREKFARFEMGFSLKNLLEAITASSNKANPSRKICAFDVTNITIHARETSCSQLPEIMLCTFKTHKLGTGSLLEVPHQTTLKLTNCFGTQLQAPMPIDGIDPNIFSFLPQKAELIAPQKLNKATQTGNSLNPSRLRKTPEKPNTATKRLRLGS